MSLASSRLISNALKGKVRAVPLIVRSDRPFISLVCELVEQQVPDPGIWSLEIIDTDAAVASPLSVADRQLLIVGHRLDDRARRWLNKGVHGVVSTLDGIATLAEGVGAVRSGESYVSRNAARLLLDQWPRSSAETVELTITAREGQVLNHLVKGLTAKGMAREMEISLKTIEAHRSRLFAKLGVSTQAQAVRRALTDPSLSTFVD
jgi:DNA-binding NarL/FixJ family response regulator